MIDSTQRRDRAVARSEDAEVPRAVRNALAWLGAAAALAGCASQPPASEPTRIAVNPEGEVVRPRAPAALSNTDPCAMQLHDLCGALLLFYFTNGHLPERLEDLAALPGEAQLSFVCPVSGKPYIYSYEGIRIPARSARVIIYDATPAHAGMRWAVIVEEPQPDKALVTDVRALPEAFFTLRPAAD